MTNISTNSDYVLHPVYEYTWYDNEYCVAKSSTLGWVLLKKYPDGNWEVTTGAVPPAVLGELVIELSGDTSLREVCAAEGEPDH